MAETAEVKNKVQYLPTGKLKLHPDNPRFIHDRDFEILCQSIENNPDYFEARPLLCTPDLVVFAGNMRLRAAKHMKLKQVPVVVMDITPERVRELMVRDNIQNGEWDVEALSAGFEMEELKAWGMPEFTFGGAAEGEESSDDEERADVDYSVKNREINTDEFEDKCALVLNYTLEDYEKVKSALFKIADTPEQAVFQLLKLENE